MEDRIAAGGGSRGRSSPEYLTAVAIIRFEVEAEFEPLMAEAGPLHRIRLWLQRRSRIRREIAELTPDDAYYLK